MNAVQIAQVCHEANRAYCKTQGDRSQVPWEDAPAWQKDSAVAGVHTLVDDPSLSPEEMHKHWMGRKIAEGWTFGEVKDEKAKTHPCIVEYKYLPPEQQMKDHLFHAVVKVLADLPPGFVHV